MPNAAPATSATPTNQRVGLLLLNLGTPDAPTPSAVRKYLAEFLSDPRVIDYPRWLWLPLLYGVILRVRPRRSARAYASIWTSDGSPLLVNSRALAEKVGVACALDGFRVELAMCYGNPSVAATIEKLAASGVRRLLVLPLYPQYSATSTAAALDRVFDALKRLRWMPEVRTIGDYHVEPAYMSALAQSVETYWREHGRGDRLLLSFHGIPERYVKGGDPYEAQCLATAQSLRAMLGMNEESLVVSFQSRVGRERWLGPYTDELLARLAHEGVERLQVLCPGFSVDCLETLEEIALRGRDQFLGAGGKRLDYIPALNSSDAHVAAMCDLILRHTSGWRGGDNVGGA